MVYSLINHENGAINVQNSLWSIREETVDGKIWSICLLIPPRLYLLFVILFAFKLKMTLSQGRVFKVFLS